MPKNNRDQEWADELFAIPEIGKLTTANSINIVLRSELLIALDKVALANKEKSRQQVIERILEDYFFGENN